MGGGCWLGRRLESGSRVGKKSREKRQVRADRRRPGGEIVYEDGGVRVEIREATPADIEEFMERWAQSPGRMMFGSAGELLDRE
jgi:hypothetical protein